VTSSNLVRIFLGAIIAVLVGTGVYTYMTIRDRQESLQSISRYDVTYSASHATVELERFENALLRFARDRTETNLKETKLRFEILVNRATILGEGGFQEFVAGHPSREQLIADLQAAIRRIDPVVTSAGLDLDVGPLLDVLQPFEGRLVGLSADAIRDSATRTHKGRAALEQLHQRFAALTFGLIICGLGLVGVLTWHNRLLAQAHSSQSRATSDLRQAAADLAAANEAVAAANGQLRKQNRRLIEKEDALRTRNVLFNAALNNMSQGLCMFDEALRPLVCNTQFEQLLRVRDVTEADWMSDEGERPSLRDLAPELAAELEENVRRSRKVEFETECYDGRIIAVAQRPMSGGGWVATFADVTKQRHDQARIAHMARHDGLTNLPNRYAFRERIQEALNACRTDGSMLAVMCVDLDNFKEVNDTFGHPTGDALLCSVAERLAGCVRDTDMVARFGGDEFAILQPHIERYDDAERLASRLLEQLRRPFLLNGELVYTTGSLGVAISPKHGNDPVVLQKNADLALYAAKADGRRTYRFFESEMDEMLANRHVLERDLRQAIANGQLRLHYQPIMHLRSMKATGFEALLRWTHPVHGAVSPSKFIPVAEDAGLITDIGRWVLTQACADAAGWPSQLKVSVNLSAAQFAQADIVQDIRAALSRAGLRPERLIVEITESLLLTESIATLDALHRLKALGVSVAMDDFGTGYSSLSYLRKYPFDRIKIDRNFVNTSDGDRSPAIIQTIVQLGAALGMTTVAEGVETQEDLGMLLAAGCLEGQGYLFSEAVPRERVFEFIRAEEADASKVA
jgi:diguanylate cyclase (GGDEF)-like protein